MYYKEKKEQKESTFVVLTLEKLEFVQECITSIERHTDPSKYKLIVVDDSKSLDVLSWVIKRPNLACVIKNPEPVGIAKAQNQALDLVDTKYVGFIGADVVIMDRRWYPEMVRVLELNEDVLGVVASQIPHGKREEFNWEEYTEGEEILKDVGRNGVPSGHFCSLFKTLYLKMIGGFDERFAWHEDIDLNKRAFYHGLRIVNTNKVWVWHYQNLVLGGVDYEENWGTSHKRFVEKWKEFDNLPDDMKSPGHIPPTYRRPL